MTEQEAFSYGFLLRCAEEGLSREETSLRVKLADAQSWLYGVPAAIGAWSLAKAAPFVAPAANAAEEAGTSLMNLGGVGLGASLAGGALGGYTLSQMQDAEVDPDAAKAQELAAAYRQYAERARRNSQRIEYRMSQTPKRHTPPRLLNAA